MLVLQVLSFGWSKLASATIEGLNLQTALIDGIIAVFLLQWVA
jgi:hypothetical protein